LIFAICPAMEPTAPAAPETTTVSPSFGLPMSSSAAYAVSPTIPRTPRDHETGAMAGSILRSPLPSERPYACQPSLVRTMSPALKRGFFDAITSATVCPTIGSPSLAPSAYDFCVLIRPRMYGSTER
jgi:hypothetical protein